MRQIGDRIDSLESGLELLEGKVAKLTAAVNALVESLQHPLVVVQGTEPIVPVEPKPEPVAPEPVAPAQEAEAAPAPEVAPEAAPKENEHAE